MDADKFYAQHIIQVAGVQFPDGTTLTSSGTTSAGFVGDGVTDNTAALTAALATVYTAGGGTIAFPTGTFLISGQITIPNDGSTTFNNGPLQPSIRITGSGAAGGLVPGGGGAVTPFGSGPAYGGTVLNMTFNASVGKIKTLGNGPLELDHITFCDTGSDTAAFVYSTNTTVNIHDCTFLGTAVGTATTNDAIVLGGASITPSGNDNAPFQGYGSVITNCWFEKVRRALFGGSYCNSVVFSENTIWSSSGYTTGGAVELGSTGAAQANYIAGNLIEATNYAYGIRVINGNNNKIIGNDCWDPTGGRFSGAVRFETGAGGNTVIGGIISPGTTPYISDAGTGSNAFFGARDPIFSAGPIGTQLKQTAITTPGTVVKMDASNAGQVVTCTTTDTGGGVAIGILVVADGNVGRPAVIAQTGYIPSTATYAPILGTGTATIGQFLIVDTTTNGRVKATSSYTAGTVIGVATTNQNTVGQPVGILLGLR